MVPVLVCKLILLLMTVSALDANRERLGRNVKYIPTSFLFEEKNPLSQQPVKFRHLEVSSSPVTGPRVITQLLNPPPESGLRRVVLRPLHYPIPTQVIPPVRSYLDVQTAALLSSGAAGPRSHATEADFGTSGYYPLESNYGQLEEELCETDENPQRSGYGELQFRQNFSPQEESARATSALQYFNNIFEQKSTGDPIQLRELSTRVLGPLIRVPLSILPERGTWHQAATSTMARGDRELFIQQPNKPPASNDMAGDWEMVPAKSKSAKLSKNYSSKIPVRRRFPKRSSKGARNIRSIADSSNQQHLSVALKQVMQRVGFEKHSEALRRILASLKPIKQAVDAARHSTTHVQNSYAKFESDLQSLLAQSRSAQQVLLFIMSSQFQENVLLRRGLEGCRSSENLLNEQLKTQAADMEDFNVLTQNLRQKMQRYDQLLLKVMKKKAAVEVQRTLLQEEKDKLNRKPLPRPQGLNKLSISTVLPKMMGQRQLGSDQINGYLLLADFFPDMDQEIRRPSFEQPKSLGQLSYTTPRPQPDNISLRRGVSEWYKVGVPLASARKQQRVPIQRRYQHPPRTAGRLTQPVQPGPAESDCDCDEMAPTPQERVSGSVGDDLVVYMLDVLVRLGRAESTREQRSIRKELATYSKNLLC